MNGVDAVVLLQVMISVPLKPELRLCSRNGKYSSLSHAKIENGILLLARNPLALGTVGGLTSFIHW
jgi:hydroxymethylglutaryl-CoA reductase